MTTDTDRPKKTLNRTTMYSLRENGDVIVHQLPFDRNDQFGAKKLEKYIARGYLFEDPRKEAAPLYVSDKPKKKKT